MINYKIKIETQSEKVLSSDITFVSGDVRAYKFTFDFFDGGVPLDIENCLLVVRARRADGKCIEDAGEVIDGRGVYVPKNSIFAVPGEVRLEIALCDSTKRYITTKIIVAEVIEGIGNECEPSGEEISVFVTLINQVQSKIEAANKLIEEAIPQRGVDYWTEEDKLEIIGELKDGYDDEMSDGSENPVQNKVIKAYVDNTFNRNIKYGNGNPSPFGWEAVNTGVMYFDTKNGDIYMCTGSTYVEKEGLHFVDWQKLHSFEEDKTVLFWEPNTKYHVGDQVFANLSESYDNYEKGIYKQVVLECIAEHTSEDDCELWIFDEDMAVSFAEHWNIKSDYELLAAKDGDGNIISKHYATKDELNETIQTAILDSWEVAV